MKKFVCLITLLACVILPCFAYADDGIDLSQAFIGTSAVDFGSQRSYTVEYKDLDPDLLCKTLLGSEYTFERQDAYGIWYSNRQGTDIALLGIFDPESATADGSGLDGGLSYIILHDGISYQEILGAVMDPEPGYQSGTVWQEHLDHDLSFESLSTVTTSVDSILDRIGLSSFRFVSGYGFEEDHVIGLLPSEVQAVPARIEEFKQVLSDCYVLFYQQFMDALPINDIPRSDKIRQQGDPTETYAVVIISENGIECMNVYSAYTFVDSVVYDTLYTLEDILNVIRAKMNKGLTVESLQVEAITKVLYPVGNAKTGISLRPVLLLSGTTSAGQYRQYIVDTITLEMLE